MKAAVFGLLTYVACTCSCSNGAGTTQGNGTTGDDDTAGARPTFSLSGSVSNPVSQVQGGRLVVGVAKVSDVPDKVLCGKLIRSYDQRGVTLPVRYQIDNVPEGTLALVAILIDGAGLSQGPGAAYMITVDGAGIHYKDAVSHMIDIHMQGTFAYDCP